MDKQKLLIENQQKYTEFNILNAFTKGVPVVDVKDNALYMDSIDNAIDNIYYQRVRLVTEEHELHELNKIIEDYLTKNGYKYTDVMILTPNIVKKRLSEPKRSIPLFDPVVTNLFIITDMNVYSRIVNHNYRQIDNTLLEYINELKEKKKEQTELNPTLKKNNVFMRSLHKLELLTEYIKLFDLHTLSNAFNRFFSLGLVDLTFTCAKKSFIPSYAHLKPFYTLDEIIKLALNEGIIRLKGSFNYDILKREVLNMNRNDICTTIQSNDIEADTLIEHQQYIIDNDSIGLIQYYTLSGSYFINTYLRNLSNYEYQNDFLETNILKLWKLVKNAPAFDNDYILYRFVTTGKHLENLKIGDIYQDKGFLSTTRNPFYQNDEANFGTILLKITIPKNIVGVGLCLELWSNFPHEEEIILAPLAKLKLISVDNNVTFYHSNRDFEAKVNKKYEFRWVGNNDIKIDKRIVLPFETKNIDFLAIKKFNIYKLNDKINYLLKHFDAMKKAQCTIGNKTYDIIAEWYNSEGSYKGKYAMTTNKGFSLYSIYDGYMLFFIEIGEINNQQQIRVNYLSRYMRLNRQKVMGDENFIKFVSSIAYFFDIPNVVIYADTLSCDNEMNITLNQDIKYEYDEQSERQMSRKKKSVDDFFDKKIKNTKRIKNLLTKSAITIDNIDDKKHDNNNNEYMILIDDLGGSHCTDFYLYIKYGIKRYQKTGILFNELQPVFKYQALDELKILNPLKILNNTDRDEIYQFYKTLYAPMKKPEDISIADFYIYIVENCCYLLDIFIKKLDRLEYFENPFNSKMYILDALAYLYNRKYISTYNYFIKMDITNEETQKDDMPKNQYRIIR